MRVIDGLHRMRAARLRGDQTIEVQYFTGDDDAAFLLAVEANTAHGLPLSLSERKAAAVRLIAMFPDRSNRSIAASAGSPIRPWPPPFNAESPRSNARTGWTAAGDRGSTLPQCQQCQLWFTEQAISTKKFIVVSSDIVRVFMPDGSVKTSKDFK